MTLDTKLGEEVVKIRNVVMGVLHERIQEPAVICAFLDTLYHQEVYELLIENGCTHDEIANMMQEQLQTFLKARLEITDG